MKNRIQTDPARFEVVKNALFSTAEEMKIIVAKTAYSPLLKIAGDYSCGVFDRIGNMVAQGPDLPGHLGSMPDAVRSVARSFSEPEPGDVYIHNDPYSGGSHLPDVNVVTPCFADGVHLGFSCVRAHWPDIGSATPGSYGAVTSIYGEGLRIPAVRLIHAGKPDPQIHRLIMANVRSPDERQGDLEAQIAANGRAGARLAALAAKYGTAELLRIMQEVIDYSENLMSAALAALPDGEAEAEELLDGDGVIEQGETQDRPFKIKVRVTKKGETVTVDFNGSDPQVAGPMNAPISVTQSGVYTAMKMIADPKNTIPPNSGCWKPIRISAPEGTVVNARLPAPVVYANHEVQQRVGELVMLAMGAITPRNVMCSSAATAGVTTFGGTDYRTGQDYVNYEVTRGGFGARPIKDGINAVASMTGNMMNTPVEIIEMNFPLLVEEYAIMPDSGGAGKFRGGCATRRSWRVLGNEARVAVCFERGVVPASGLMGGGAGTPTRIFSISASGEKRQINTKGTLSVEPGGRIYAELPGAGGYGDPRERDRAAVLEDVIDGYVSREAALAIYGVDVDAPAKAAG